MSRKRSPSFSISLLQMCSSLASCASASVHAGVAVVGAGIDPLRVEPEGVEVVGDVVVELDLLGVGLGPVARLGARQAHELLQPADRRRRPPPRRPRSDRPPSARRPAPSARACRRRCRSGPRRSPRRPCRSRPVTRWATAERSFIRSVTRGVLRADAPAAGQHHRQRRRQGPESLLERGGSGDRRHGGFLRKAGLYEVAADGRDAASRTLCPRGRQIPPSSRKLKTRGRSARPAAAAAAASMRSISRARAQREPVGRRSIVSSSISASRRM